MARPRDIRRTRITRAPRQRLVGVESNRLQPAAAGDALELADHSAPDAHTSRVRSDPQALDFAGVAIAPSKRTATYWLT